jgi:hypothetical protein
MAICANKPKTPCISLKYRGFWVAVVDRPGFEPGQAEPKSAVLPLHHRSDFKNFWCKSNKNMVIYLSLQWYKVSSIILSPG